MIVSKSGCGYRHGRLAGAVLMLSAVANLLGTARAMADPLSVTIIAAAPDGSPARPVSWSATPMDLPPDADMLAAMTMTPDPVLGPWQVALDPGRYLISGFTEVEVYETEVTLPDAGSTIVVPVLSFEQTVAFRCTAAPVCDYADPATGLALTVPNGWALDQPYRADLGDGDIADEISAVVYQDVQEETAAVWFLNPHDWIVDDNGPCREVSVGYLCTFDVTETAETAFAILAPSLKVIPPAANPAP